ncbi:MAG: VIT domain-containing protein [Thermoanaerobaculum sp.]
MNANVEELISGLFIATLQKPIPLVGVSVVAEIHGLASRVVLRQKFRNQEESPVEAVYVFPLPEGAALSNLIIETGGKRIVGKVQKREEAFETYDEALAEGHGAVLVDQVRPNVYKVYVGNLLPQQELAVELQWVAELEWSGDSLRFLLPTTVAPRYAPLEDQLGISPTPAEQVNPPVTLEVPYRLEFTAFIDHPLGVKSVSSPSHPIEWQPDNGSIRVHLAESAVAMDRDLVLLVTLQKEGEPFVLVSPSPQGGCVVAATFFPQFSSTLEDRAFTFLVDCSGSMVGSSFELAKEGLAEALGQLTANDTFDIVVFGSTVGSLLGGYRPADPMWLAKAREKVAQMKANLGGTELLQALRFVLDRSRLTTKNSAIFLITDGDITNEREVFEMVRKNRGDTTRVFVIGVGYGPNEYLVRSLARAGHGAAELVHPKEPLTPAILRQMQRARGPMFQKTRLRWVGCKPKWQAPDKPLLFAHTPVTVYGYFATGCPSKVAWEAQYDGQTWVCELDVPKPASGNSSPLPLLAARAAIRTWEEERTTLLRVAGSAQVARRNRLLEQKIVKLSLEYNLLSSFTSLVAVEEREHTTQNLRPVLRRVPTTLTHGWGGIEVVYADLPPVLESSFRVRYLKLEEPHYHREPKVFISQSLLDWLKAHRTCYLSELPAAMARDPLLLEEVLWTVDAILTKESFTQLLALSDTDLSAERVDPKDVLEFFLAVALLECLKKLPQFTSLSRELETKVKRLEDLAESIGTKLQQISKLETKVKRLADLAESIRTKLQQISKGEDNVLEEAEDLQKQFQKLGTELFDLIERSAKRSAKPRRP